MSTIQQFIALKKQAADIAAHMAAIQPEAVQEARGLLDLGIREMDGVKFSVRRLASKWEYPETEYMSQLTETLLQQKALVSGIETDLEKELAALRESGEATETPGGFSLAITLPK